jgi:hypothetical protein
MGSSGKKKTTMAKLMRESKLRERRLDKAARKDERKRGVGVYAPDAPGMALDPLTGEPIDGERAGDGEPTPANDPALAGAPAAGEPALTGGRESQAG